MWSQVFWKNPPQEDIIDDRFAPMPPYRKLLTVLPIVILGVVTLYIGLNAEAIINVTDKISSQLMDNSAYIEAVLGDKTN